MTQDTPAGVLAGQYALITGASEGIGLGIAESMVRAGAHVMIAARRREQLDIAQAQLRGIAHDDQKIEIAEVDIRSAESVAAMFDEADKAFGALNIFVANAGSGSMVPFLEMTEEVWQGTIDLNINGTFRTCHQAATRMAAREDKSQNAAILVISSVRALGTRPGTHPLRHHQGRSESVCARGRLRTGRGRRPDQRAVAGYHGHPDGIAAQSGGVREDGQDRSDGPGRQCRRHGCGCGVSL